jgi:hypothetical protein
VTHCHATLSNTASARRASTKAYLAQIDRKGRLKGGAARAKPTV